MIKINKKGVTLIDSIFAIMILSILTLLYYGGLQAYYKYSERVERVSYTNIALTECAEVIHSFRYGSIDRHGSAGWNVFNANFTSGLYHLEYDEDISSWGIIPIYKDVDTNEPFLSFREMMETVGYTDDTLGETYMVGTEFRQFEMRRYVFINTNNPEKAHVTCYARYQDRDRFTLDAESDLFNYVELRFTMTDYL